MRDIKKRIRSSIKPEPDSFDTVPDDILIIILSKLSSSSSSPSDFINALITCRRFNRLALCPLVLSTSNSNIFSIRAKNWSDSAEQFVNRCVNAGCIEAFYFLGMVRFYCMGRRVSGACLMAKAAMKSHAPSLYSLAVIHFNARALRAGVALCARAAFLGHVEALRELGHCLQDGYGVARSVFKGRRLLVQANARELATLRHGSDSGHELVNRFLREWFEFRGGLSGFGLGLCCYSGCGRPETRLNEFRKCSACGVTKYCSRVCQANDWKRMHKAGCGPVVLVGGQAVEDVGRV